ncbi:putative penicillin-binding protein [Amylocarpus encephaloides]|uniref:Penicillin-binding protein n=1 Tax=Amylocarpus encephaloides TaxID=45428 RepID=A0A9P7YPU2_9HELO|nr:putative penicillin-binding protein [Amylocarpus encephaloides]
MQSLLISALLLTLTAASQHILEDDNTNPFTPGFAKLANETLDFWHVPGVSVAVVDGEDTWTSAYGFSNLHPLIPVTTDTLFYGASTTKAFTALSLALLISSGNHTIPPSPPSSSLLPTKLSWKTTVSSLLGSDFILNDGYLTEHVTLEDILSHRSGVPRHDLSYGSTARHEDDFPENKNSSNEEKRKKGIKDVLRSLRYLDVTAGLRERWQYCNIMYVVASAVIEKLSGRELGRFLAGEVWGVLGMDRTYFTTPSALHAPSPLAQGYVYIPSNHTYLPVPYMDLTLVSGAGSIISNVHDYSKWLRFLMSGDGPLSLPEIKEYLKPRMLMEDDGKKANTGPQAYALGWMTGSYGGYEYFEHSGGLEAFGTEVIFFPALNFGVTAFGNTGITSNAAEQRLVWHLIDEKLGIPPEKRFDWNQSNLKAWKQMKHAYENAPSIYYPSLPSPPFPLPLPLENYTGTYTHPAYQNLTIALCNSSSPSDPTSPRFPFATPPAYPSSSPSPSSQGPPSQHQYQEEKEKEKQTLCASRRSFTWPIILELSHISGNYFMAYADSTTAPGMVFKQALPAEFAVGVDGVVGRVGVAFEPEMGREGRVWFERVE